MLKEHQSSLVNLEARCKQLAKGKGMRNIADDIEVLKVELERKQDKEAEQLLRTEIAKQEREIKRLKEECRVMNESYLKNKPPIGVEASKELLDLKDQIVTLTNLVK